MEVHTRLGGKFDVNERKDVLEKMERKKNEVCFSSKFSLGGFFLGQVSVYHTSESLKVIKEKMYWKTNGVGFLSKCPWGMFVLGVGKNFFFKTHTKFIDT